MWYSREIFIVLHWCGVSPSEICSRRCARRVAGSRALGDDGGEGRGRRAGSVRRGLTGGSNCVSPRGSLAMESNHPCGFVYCRKTGARPPVRGGMVLIPIPPVSMVRHCIVVAVRLGRLGSSPAPAASTRPAFTYPRCPPGDPFVIHVDKFRSQGFIRNAWGCAYLIRK